MLTRGMTVVDRLNVGGDARNRQSMVGSFCEVRSERQSAGKSTSPPGRLCFSTRSDSISGLQSDPTFKRLAEQAIERCRIIAGFSEASGAITRTFLSHPMRDCHRAVSGWMKQLGMSVAVDAAGNFAASGEGEIVVVDC